MCILHPYMHYIHACTTYMHACMHHTCIICPCMYTYACMYVCMHACMYVCMCVCVYSVYVYVCICICMHACMCVCVYTCICVYAYVCMHGCLMHVPLQIDKYVHIYAMLQPFGALCTRPRTSCSERRGSAWSSPADPAAPRGGHQSG